jgi:transcriptional regulator with XRE-family HTH domain
MQTTELGERLRAARESRGLSTQATAEQARISTGYVSKLESGRVGTPSPRVLHRLADVLAVSYWDLMRLAGYMTVPDAPESLLPPPADRAAVSAAEPPTNERIVELLEAIRSELGELRAEVAALRG